MTATLTAKVKADAGGRSVETQRVLASHFSVFLLQAISLNHLVPQLPPLSMRPPCRSEARGGQERRPAAQLPPSSGGPGAAARVRNCGALDRLHQRGGADPRPQGALVRWKVCRVGEVNAGMTGWRRIHVSPEGTMCVCTKSARAPHLNLNPTCRFRTSKLVPALPGRLPAGKVRCGERGAGMKPWLSAGSCAARATQRVSGTRHLIQKLAPGAELAPAHYLGLLAATNLNSAQHGHAFPTHARRQASQPLIGPGIRG